MDGEWKLKHCETLFILFLKIREEVGSVKEKFEEKVMKVCGEYLHNQSGISREEGREGRRSRYRKSCG